MRILRGNFLLPSRGYVQFSRKWRQNPKSRFENFFSSIPSGPRCTASIKSTTFSRASYLLRKCQKSPSLQTSAIKPRTDLLKVSTNKLKL